MWLWCRSFLPQLAVFLLLRLLGVWGLLCLETRSLTMGGGVSDVMDGWRRESGSKGWQDGPAHAAREAHPGVSRPLQRTSESHCLGCNLHLEVEAWTEAAGGSSEGRHARSMVAAGFGGSRGREGMVVPHATVDDDDNDARKRACRSAAASPLACHAGPSAVRHGPGLRLSGLTPVAPPPLDVTYRCTHVRSHEAGRDKQKRARTCLKKPPPRGPETGAGIAGGGVVPCVSRHLLLLPPPQGESEKPRSKKKARREQGRKGKMDRVHRLG